MPYFSSAVHLHSLCFVSPTPSLFDKVMAPIHLQTTLRTCPHPECLTPPIDPPHLSLLVLSTPSPVSYLTHSFPCTSLPLRGLSPMLVHLFPHTSLPSRASSLTCLISSLAFTIPHPCLDAQHCRHCLTIINAIHFHLFLHLQFPHQHLHQFLTKSALISSFENHG